jgi:hypothetical protein
MSNTGAVIFQLFEAAEDEAGIRRSQSSARVTVGGEPRAFGR